MRSRLLPLALLGLLLVFVQLSPADKKVTEATQKRISAGSGMRVRLSSAERKIGLALQQPITFDFTDQPLNEVIDFVIKTHKIPVVIDIVGLDEEGVGTDTPITMNLRDITLASGLSIITSQIKLDWILRNEVIVITSSKVADSTRSIQVYDAKALCGQDKDASKLVEAITKLLRVSKGSKSTRTITSFRHLLLVNGTRKDHSKIEKVLSTLAVAVKGNPVKRKATGAGGDEGAP